jgi:hypothetical protein
MDESSDVVRVEGVSYGIIGHIGPPPHAVISDLEETNKWTAVVQKEFVRGSDSGAVNQQNDLFLQALEEFESNSPTLIVTTQDSKTKRQPECFKVCTPCQQVLFLFKRGSDKTSWKMGIAPEGTREGDEVVFLFDVQKAVIMRSLDNGDRMVCGTARTSGDLLSPEAIKRLVLSMKVVCMPMEEDILMESRILKRLNSSDA